MVEPLQRYAAQNLEQQVSETDPFTLERYEQFHAFLAPGTRTVLDAGANTGRGGERLKQLNPAYRLTALDCVAERLKLLPAAYSSSICGLSNKIPAEDKSFDAVVAGEFLEHLYPADVDPTLCEFQRVLKVGGRLLMTTPNPNYVRLWWTRRTVYTVSHETQHYASLLKMRLKMHGFSRVRVYGSGKMSRHLGYYLPLPMLYGSYLISADKW